MNILMLQSRYGYAGQDGDDITYYEKGNEYDVRDHLAKYFFSEGYATSIKEEA